VVSRPRLHRRAVGLGVASFGPTVSVWQALGAEFVGTFILVFTIFGAVHHKASPGFAGVAIGLVVFAAIIPVAPATGASINPARTFGPMLVQQIAGGAVKWQQLPVYLIAEFLAGALAALAYRAITPQPQDSAAPSTDAPPVPAQATESPATV
jgi:glycerol uptake facilitator protein